MEDNNQKIIELVDKVLHHQREQLTLEGIEFLAKTYKMEPQHYLEKTINEMNQREQFWDQVKMKLTTGDELRKLNGRRGGFSVELVRNGKVLDRFEVVGE